MTAVIVEAAVTAAQTKIGAVEAAGGDEVEAEAEAAAVAVAKAAVAVTVMVTVNPTIGGETKTTKKITGTTKTKMVIQLHRVHLTHTKTKSVISAVLSAISPGTVPRKTGRNEFSFNTSACLFHPQIF